MICEPSDPRSPDQVIAAVRTWLESVVIGLNLCPFAAEPNQHQRIRIEVSAAHTTEALLTDLQGELRRIDRQPATQVETTLLVVPHMLGEFEDYNQFLALADALLQTFGWEGEYQIASFHPNYQFAETAPDDADNLTNRSPYPILHILREDSIEAALAHHPDPDGIPTRNIQTVRGLDRQQRQRLFPYLFGPTSKS